MNTTANKITIFRVLMIPVFLVLAYTGHRYWALAVVLLREFAVSGMRLVAVEQGRVIAAAWSGKVKTAATMVCLCLMLYSPAPGIGDSAPDIVAQIGTAVILLTTVYSGIEYFCKNRDVFKEVK